MTIDDSTIDIHLTKLVVDRRHCSKDWNEQSVAIRAKVRQALLDMLEHDEIKRLLGSSCTKILSSSILMNYFLRIFGLFLLS
ncbi:unnamed protein product [Rotaria sordida]|uniref:Uncharacterized protein n=1 Tax=Rotaria sordida TaxID=392033 RepID=A0A815VIQ6_9BILA|nr:unnamed protein product [Rotaria sordida]CAF1666482.1 unnamed protein product [Rotaria sordida]